MKTLEQKILDFKTKFSLGSWLDEDKNFCEVEQWFKDNFSTEVLKPIEAPKVEDEVELPISTENVLADGVELPITSVEVTKDVNNELLTKDGETVTEMQPTSIVEKKEGFLIKH